MAKHKSKGHHRRERSSTPTTPDVSRNKPNGFTPSPVEMKDEFTQINGDDDFHSSRRPLVPRILTGCASATRPTVPSHRDGNPVQSTPRRRVAEPFSSPLASATKSPVRKITRSDLASNDVAIARRAEKNEVTFSSLTGKVHSSPAGTMGTLTPDMSKSQAARTGKQTFTWGVSPFKAKYDQNTALASNHVTAALPTRTHNEHTDSKRHEIHPKFKAPSGPEASGTACKACGSLWHVTKDCHVPSRDGTVVICPFHGCCTLDNTDPGFHHLDGLAGLHRSWCMLVSSYELAVRAGDTDRKRYMLPQMFGALVLNRKRKPFCRVLNLEVCPINIAIEFSREFCQGQMPSGLEGAWPYTKMDTTKSEIRNKLRQYDELGWEGMPPGELESKSWDQIKREYAQGVIPPQVFTYPNGRGLYYQEAAFKLAAEVARKDVELQTVEGAEDSTSSAEEEGAEQSITENDVLLEKMRLLSAKMDSVIERLDASEGRQTAGEPGTNTVVTGNGTHSDPIDLDTDTGSVHWCVE